MRLGYFTMPLHPFERDTTVTLHEDRQTIILADKLGFYDAFVGEHLTDKAENVTNSLLFLATLIPETKTIKLGSGTSNLSHSHPTLLASQAAMFDHLAKGRFIFGISPGALASDAEALGILDQDRIIAVHPVLEGRRLTRVAPDHRHGAHRQASGRFGSRPVASDFILGRTGDHIPRRSLEVYQAVGNRLATSEDRS
jgi:alkanesulfonate monooxygenase SsuD/methylene tetrahydromethanopterin reductase-like flavin-dependent oxidoreductase (luciferase family)